MLWPRPLPFTSLILCVPLFLVLLLFLHPGHTCGHFLRFSLCMFFLGDVFHLQASTYYHVSVGSYCHTSNCLLDFSTCPSYYYLKLKISQIEFIFPPKLFIFCSTNFKPQGHCLSANYTIPSVVKVYDSFRWTLNPIYSVPFTTILILALIPDTWTMEINLLKYF